MIENLFWILLDRFQVGLKQRVEGRKLVFNHADALHSGCNKINLNHSKSYIDSPE